MGVGTGVGVGVGTGVGVGVGCTQAPIWSSNSLVHPRLPVGSSQAVISTVAVCACVAGVTAMVFENEEPNENGEPATSTSSIDTSTEFVPFPLYWVRLMTSPPWQVRDTFGVCAETAVGARSATADHRGDGQPRHPSGQARAHTRRS